MGIKKQLHKTVGILILGMSLCTTVMLIRAESIPPDVFDAGQYVRGAYNIFHHGIFSEIIELQRPTLDGQEMPPRPRIGREPLYSFVLSSIFYFEPGATGISADCLYNRGLCPEENYIHGKWLNILLFSVSGALAALLGWAMTKNYVAGAIAGLAIWINFSAQKDMLYMVSDPLALALGSALTLAVYLAMKNGHILSWGIAGLLLASLTLTKAIFLYFIPAILLFLAAWFIQNEIGRSRTARIVVCSVFLLCLCLPLHTWMKRNHSISGQYAITVERSGIALNTRDHLNNMTWQEFGASFVFWIRDCGDSLAATLFPTHHWKKLTIEDPVGYYLKAQLGYGTDVEQVSLDQGVSVREARKIVDSRIISNILERPFKHIIINIAVFWRGIWVDEFIVLSLPGLCFLIIWAVKTGNLAILAALSPSLFNLLIYPTISLNIPRYQLTALPALSLGSMFAVMWVINLIRRRNRIEDKHLF